ncbi:S53 family peptidase [Edaphobacter albus]|uniref:S53 family peptidase n=1 Tax=Edaphobacter sp. 4G125 TaxID=2763071 RepID=UPI001648C172|nr:S53 family peptidase [Edaphobacter sp. 4G125]QNI37610.1 S8/S53 family peptidase [Edaphobacter sp. 4G125]
MASRKSVSHFSTQPRTLLPGSEKNPIAPGDLGNPISSRHRITVSVMVRRKVPLQAEHTTGEQRLTRAQFRASHAADPAAVKLVRAFAKEYGLTIQPGTPAPGRRTMKLTGTITNLQRAFGVTLVHKSIGDDICRVRQGGIYLPQELVGPVVAILGLDNRPQAQPHFRFAGDTGAAANRIAQAGGFARPHASAISYTPVQVGQLYGFPSNSTAANQTIALLELGGGFRQADITAYFKSLGQKPPQVIAVSVSGAKNSPSNANGADGEVMLDIEVAAAVAPGARIVVYFAPNTDQGFIDAIGAAVHDTKYKPSILSISWGAPEVRWTAQAMNALDAVCQSAAALGITITVAAGDNGSSDGITDTQNHVDFPASSPHVLACGGTSLQSSNGAITAETVWNDQGGGATGGGVSNTFALPSWQSGANVPKPTTSAGGRGVPDVAGNADPNTGYTIRVDGQTIVIGGTSAVAPLWAGLIALANQQNGASAGFINPAIYTATAKAAFHDITQGNNGAFQATIGWDACTGLGSPIAPQLIPVVKPTSAPTKKKPAKSKGKKTAAKKSARTVARKKLPGKKKPPTLTLKRGKSNR